MVIQGKAYDVLKAFALLWLPTLATAYMGLAEYWDLPKVHEIVGSIVVIDTALGFLLKISSSNYDASGAKFDGKILVEPNEDGVSINFHGLAEALDAGKEEVTFKVVDVVPAGKIAPPEEPPKS
jgi:hypothetical protein